MSQVATITLRSPAHVLEATGLHDATLVSVTMSWAKAQASAAVVLLSGVDATLTFYEVTAAVLPRELPWGPSVLINQARTLPDGKYEIEMQSGDTLLFSASSWSICISAAPGVA